MGQDTAISWTDATWNPLRGCTKVSDGCKFCYAMGVAARFNKPGQPYEGLARMVGGQPQWTNRIRLLPDKLDEPIRWQKPRRIFVNSMSDLFHPDVPVEYIARVFAAMALAPQHTFQVLTKRPERMEEVLSDRTFYKRVLDAADHEFRATRPKLGNVPISDPTLYGLPNVWLGTSIESNEQERRAYYLRYVPAAVRFLSCEPLLGPLDDVSFRGIGWVIVGGESGRHMPAHPERQMDHAWARDISRWCVARGIPFFFKQSSGVRSGMGAALVEEDGSAWEWHQFPGHMDPPRLVTPAREAV
jgi:protein gp37